MIVPELICTTDFVIVTNFCRGSGGLNGIIFVGFRKRRDFVVM